MKSKIYIGVLVLIIILSGYLASKNFFIGSAQALPKDSYDVYIQNLDPVFMDQLRGLIYFHLRIEGEPVAGPVIDKVWIEIFDGAASLADPVFLGRMECADVEFNGIGLQRAPVPENFHWFGYCDALSINRSSNLENAYFRVKAVDQAGMEVGLKNIELDPMGNNPFFGPFSINYENIIPLPADRLVSGIYTWQASLVGNADTAWIDLYRPNNTFIQSISLNKLTSSYESSSWRSDSWDSASFDDGGYIARLSYKTFLRSENISNVWTEDFKIMNSICTPDCQNRECGNDGCGGSCGECSADRHCNDITGECVSGMCSIGQRRDCGPATDQGACQFGSQECVIDGWSECIGAVMPVSEDCTNGIDDDCDGYTDSDDSNCSSTVCIPQWTCSGWSSCSADGVQVQTCTDLNSCGTTVDRPPLEQTCTQTCTPSWDCAVWSDCQNNIQICQEYFDNNQCGVSYSAADMQKICSTGSEVAADCEPNWDCANWTVCMDNIRTRTCKDANDCETAQDKPALEQECEVSETCSPDAWECGEWSKCSLGSRSRDCTRNNCGTVEQITQEENGCLDPDDNCADREWVCDRNWSECSSGQQRRYCRSDNCGELIEKSEFQPCQELLPNETKPEVLMIEPIEGNMVFGDIILKAQVRGEIKSLSFYRELITEDDISQSDIKLIDSGVRVEGTEFWQGLWSTNETTPVGDYFVYAEIIDNKGNKYLSNYISIRFDPVYNPIDNPKDVSFSGEVNKGVVLQEPRTKGILQEDKLKIIEVENFVPVIGRNNIVFKGVGPPNTWLTLYIYSDSPIVVDTKTDANGNFVYTLDKDLFDGEHEVYVTVTNEAGRIQEKSSAFTFFIRRAQAVTKDEYLRGDVDVEIESAAAVNSFLLIAVIIVAVVIIGFVVAYYISTKPKTPKTA